MRPTDAGNRFPVVLLPGIEQRAHAVQLDALGRVSFGLRKPGEVETPRRFVGRDREITQFRAAVATPGELCVHGPGGVGKSALLDVLADVAEREGISPSGSAAGTCHPCRTCCPTPICTSGSPQACSSASVRHRTITSG
ncbi:hypothetical protein GCM10009548_83060 [Streptomyces malaysiensis subsp. malaysiensis]|uniref:ATP-binding protein n=1 Tax=Streptomyces malaysiensis TaxID=92644 RepID=A0ABX6VWD4_STRMQ|nr:ATP-binding protein [Streptomyces solisilvae]